MMKRLQMKARSLWRALRQGSQLDASMDDDEMRFLHLSSEGPEPGQGISRCAMFFRRSA